MTTFESTILIPLTQGYSAIVDVDLYDTLNMHSWCILKSHSGSLYACRSIRINGGKTTKTMHRLVWELVNGAIPDGMFIDHINHDGLDNRIDNLRLVTNRQNLQNLKGKSTGKYSSRFPGVYWHTLHRKWRVQARSNGKMKYLGCYEIEEDAYAAYVDFNTLVGLTVLDDSEA